MEKEFELPYALAGRFLTACEEMGVIKYSSNGIQISVTRNEYIKNKERYLKVLTKHNLL